jgi:hypothetical protein
VDLGGTNQANNVVLQSVGKIVPSGSPIGVSTSDNHTEIARLTPSGNPDANFNTDATLQISSLRVGDGLAIQPDGKIILGGFSEDVSSVGYVLARVFP